jgi:hypothetical protein
MYTSFKEHAIQFVSAFDKLQEQRRKLFDIQDIDNQFNFLDRKNICIINRSFKKLVIIFYILFLHNFVLIFVLAIITLQTRKIRQF